MTHDERILMERIANSLEQIANRLIGIEFGTSGLISPVMVDALKAIVKISEALEEKDKRRDE